MGLVGAYILRLERRKQKIRALRKSFQLKNVTFRFGQTDPDAITLYSVLRNEMPRLEYFLAYYRNLGVGHFCFVDNESTDFGREFLASQPDCSVWLASGSYAAANFGTDWLNYLINKYSENRWILAVDVDELFVYAHCECRKIDALTHWLDQQERCSFSAMQVDMYSKLSADETVCPPGESPLAISRWFDAGNYSYHLHTRYLNLWILGGPRQRIYFADQPLLAPALNKIPLVKWRRGYVFVGSTHALLPRFLNICYDKAGGEMASGCLLHTKLQSGLRSKAFEEVERQEHYAKGREYKSYLVQADNQTNAWNVHSTFYESWRTLEECGLMSVGGWL